MATSTYAPPRGVRVFVTGSGFEHESMRRLVAESPGFELLGAGDHRASLAVLNGNVDVVLLAATGERPLADELAEVHEQTQAPVILVASANADSVLEQALNEQLADVLVLPQSIEAVAFALRRAARSRHEEQQDKVATVVTVFAPKGGVGKTVVSTNLAAASAQAGLRTLLVDLDLQFGDAALMLGVAPQKTVYDLVSSAGALDAEKLAGYTTVHSSDLALLAAPPRPEQGEHVLEQGVASLVDVARTSYDVVVIDTPPSFDPAVLASLDRTDHLLLLSGPDVTSVKNLRTGLQTLDLLRFPRERVRLVYNRCGTQGGVKRADLEQTLGQPLAFVLPDDRLVFDSVNRGKPAVVAAPGGPFSKAVNEVAAELFGIRTVRPERKSLLARGRKS